MVGFWPGMIVGGARTTWRLVGAWALVPLTVIPLSIALALLLGAPLLAAEGAALIDAIWTVGAEREWLTTSMGRIGHAGPVALVIILPMLQLRRAERPHAARHTGRRRRTERGPARAGPGCYHPGSWLGLGT